MVDGLHAGPTHHLLLCSPSDVGAGLGGGGGGVGGQVHAGDAHLVIPPPFVTLTVLLRDEGSLVEVHGKGGAVLVVL